MYAVEFKHVTKRLNDFSLDNINFAIPKGFVTGIVGPNGSGKTTIIQLMMNILHPDSGNISLLGKQPTDYHIKQKIGFVYDDLFMYENFNIIKMKSFIAPFYETWNDTLFRKYVDIFDLPMRKKIKHFSKGMKIKCSFLFALAHEPEFIIMDEPTIGLDPIFRRELIDLLQDLMIHEEQTIFLSTHNTSDLDRFADYLIFINKGKIILQTSKIAIQENYRYIQGSTKLLDQDIRNEFIGLHETNGGFTGLYKGDISLFDYIGEDALIHPPTIEEILYFLTKGRVEDVENNEE